MVLWGVTDATGPDSTNPALAIKQERGTPGGKMPRSRGRLGVPRTRVTRERWPGSASRSLRTQGALARRKLVLHGSGSSLSCFGSRNPLSLPDEPRSLLNGPQRRHFEVLLGMLQETLSKVERLASEAAPEAGGPLVYKEDLPPEFAASIEPVVAELRRLIARLSADLGLRRRAVSRSRSIRALLTAEMVRLEDSTADKLRGYGPIDPRVGTTVDPVLRELHALLGSILRIVDSAPMQRTEG